VLRWFCKDTVLSHYIMLYVDVLILSDWEHRGTDFLRLHAVLCVHMQHCPVCVCADLCLPFLVVTDTSR